MSGNIHPEKKTDCTTLDVPYFIQRGEHYCGAAALEMVIRYYRRSKLTKFSQDGLYRSLAEREPTGTGSYRIKGEDIIATALKRSFCAGWGRVHPDVDLLKVQIKELVLTRRIPLIACQRYTNEQPELGHFRVIIGAVEDHAVVHDPHPKFGGAAQKWQWEKLLDWWRCTGSNVTGGVAIWVGRESLPEGLLCPAVPNPWLAISDVPNLYQADNSLKATL